MRTSAANSAKADAEVGCVPERTMLLISCQLHREFTTAFLAACASGSIKLVQVPSECLHTDFISSKHRVYVGYLE